MLLKSGPHRPAPNKTENTPEAFTSSYMEREEGEKTYLCGVHGIMCFCVRMYVYISIYRLN